MKPPIWCLLVIASCLASGCGKMQQAQDRVRAVNDMKQLGILYLNYCDVNRKGPSSAEDLKQMTGGDADAAAVLQELQAGKYVLIWGVHPPTAVIQGQGPRQHLVIGHVADAPTQGGPVLFLDGSVQTVTAEEFGALKKAQPTK